MFRFLRKIPSKKVLTETKIFLTKLKKQFMPLNDGTEACHCCGTCKHLCSYMKTTKKGSRDVQIS